MKCEEKKPYPSRMAAEAAVARTRRDWLRKARNGVPDRYPEPPQLVYLCPTCLRWHMSHWNKRV